MAEENNIRICIPYEGKQTLVRPNRRGNKREITEERNPSFFIRCTNIGNSRLLTKILRSAVVTLWVLLHGDVLSYSQTTHKINSDNNYSLFFAVEDYKNLPALYNPIEDARQIAQELQTRYQFKTEVIPNPTRREIQEKLEFYRDQFRSGAFDLEGQLFLFFSGHGILDTFSNNGFFIPKDGDPKDLYTTSISYAIWRPIIDNFNCKHILTAIAACFSGTFDPRLVMKSGREDNPFWLPGFPGEREVILVTHQKLISRPYLASSALVETPDKSQFAKKLLKGLQEGGTGYDLLTVDAIFALYIKPGRHRFSASSEKTRQAPILFSQPCDR